MFLLKKLEIDRYKEEEIYRHRIKHFFKDILADKVSLFFQYNVAGRDFKHAGEGSSGLKATLQRLGLDPRFQRGYLPRLYHRDRCCTRGRRRGVDQFFNPAGQF